MCRPTRVQSLLMANMSFIGENSRNGLKRENGHMQVSPSLVQNRRGLSLLDSLQATESFPSVNLSSLKIHLKFWTTGHLLRSACPPKMYPPASSSLDDWNTWLAQLSTPPNISVPTLLFTHFQVAAMRLVRGQGCMGSSHPYFEFCKMPWRLNRIQVQNQFFLANPRISFLQVCYIETTKTLMVESNVNSQQ
jgi:hypothetical protein